MQRTQTAEVGGELLRLGRKAEALEQPRGVGIGRVLEDRIGTDDERRALGRVDDLDRIALLLLDEHVVLVAVRHHGAFAERQLLGRIGRRLHLHYLLLGEFLEILPTEVARHLERRGHDGAAVARMRLDDLARPFRIEQVGIAPGRLLGRLHHVGVVADDADPGAEGRERAVRILVLLRIELGHVLRQIGLENAFALPDDEVGGIGRIDHVDGVDPAGIFLTDALKHAFGAGALHAHRDAGIFRLERLGDALRDRQVDRGVVDDLAFLLRRLEQLRRDCAGGRSRRGDRGDHARCRERRRSLEHVPPGECRLPHRRLLA
jgi:hypothetical protein